MIKQILVLIAKVLESKLKKSGIEELILQNQNYFTEAKKIFNMVDENERISKTIEEKISSKVEAFNKSLLAKFQELSQEDVDNLRQAVAGEINQGKEAVLDNATIIKQLQDSNTKILAENTDLKNKLANINSQSVVENSNTVQV